MSAFLLSCPCGGDGGHTLAHSWSCKYSIEHHPGHGRAKGSLGPLAASRGELGWSSLSVCLSVCLSAAVCWLSASQSVSQSAPPRGVFQVQQSQIDKWWQKELPKALSVLRCAFLPSFLASLLPSVSDRQHMHANALSRIVTNGKA